MDLIGLRGALGVLLGVVVIAASTACSSSTEQADSTTPDTSDSTDMAEPGETPDQLRREEAPAAEWEERVFDERRQLMVNRVMPEMSAAFREFDAERYADFSCATCHMPNFQDVNFHMPNGLAPLNPADIPTLRESTDERIARTAQFMFQNVLPDMVQILDVEPYNPETHEGFGCLNCHATATP